MKMINCKFTKDELYVISAAIKLASVYHISDMMELYNGSLASLSSDSKIIESMKIENEQDMRNYLIGLRGNVKGLIRND